MRRTSTIWVRETLAIKLEDVSAHGDGSYLLGTTYINEYPFHVNAIRVKGELGEYDGTDTDAEEVLADFYGVYESRWQRIKIKGRRGEYVVLIHPHGD
jgi:hypothetical protein